MRILLYTRNSRVPDCLEAFGEATGEDDDLRGRNASAHAEGQIETCDRVLVDDDFPAIYEEYLEADAEAELFTYAEVVGEAPETEAETAATGEDDEADVEAYDPLSDLTVAELREALGEVEDVARLEALAEAEDRTTAVGAIEARIDELAG